MSIEWFKEFVKCDSNLCPARVKGYYILRRPDESDLILGFCQHHFFFNEKAITKLGFEVAATDGDLTRDERFYDVR